ncbi:MAG: adenosylmethionine--8-amino-7-oxononanoate transaminase [Nitrospirae bacterium]|nr:adenosylmethionine--8-amino-7-oxononanoate transaminase [Nitrospirota bacterium]
MKNKRELQDADKKFVWHPFTQMKDWQREDPLIIDEGKGCFLKDLDGRWYLDGISSMWVNLFGHKNAALDGAIKAQIDKISHSTLLGLSNRPAIELAERLVAFFGSTLNFQPSSSLSRVFYSDNGSTAVEVALKMAFQYWMHKGDTAKSSFLCLDNAYHGDTIGAVSVGGIDIFHNTFSPLLFKTFHAPSPYCYRCGSGRGRAECSFECLEKTEEILRTNHREIAAFIIEPIVQAAGGMIVSPPGYLGGIRDLCRKYGVLMIADEVATGFGRTGKMFACEHERVVPDIVCISKGLTGGYLPLAVTMATDEIYNAFLGEFRDLKTFFHGHSYTGNQLGCAAALACLDIFRDEDVIEGLAPRIALLTAKLDGIAALAHVGDVRQKGLMAGIELVSDKQTKEPYRWEEKMGWKVTHRARQKGLLIRPLGNILVIMPPLIITEKDLSWMMDVIGESILEVT